MCTLAEQQAPDRHARAACTQAGGAFHTRGRLRERAKSYAKALANDILR
ncbi:hypothetical protein GOP44_24000 [Escherichia coli]|nr:hypothetical protein [Escherichia coli]EFH3068414.1 hypothetical protein [Escherichia coli]EFH3087216.1 hypothetical protein [Escherichia coli]EFH3539596.1 hypothetical protein [Escherichia coli]EFH3550847.1 hypothetical protein [Escherichia coli]